MSEDLDLCPVCNEGHMEPKRVSVSGEPQGQFRETASTREFVCDKCGHKQVNAGLSEYVSTTDSVNQEKQEGSNKEQIDVIEKINNDSLQRLYELTHHKDWMGKEVGPTKSDQSVNLKLKEDIRANTRLLAELGIGTPVIAVIKKRIEDAYSLQNSNF